MKVIIFDSSTIINFAMNGILPVLVKLRKSFPGKFIITKSVKYEVVDRPLQIKKFELGALQIKQLIDLSVLEMPESLGISQQQLSQKTQEIINLTNHIFASGERWMEIIHQGEASCLALSLLAAEKNIQSMLAVDERTTRMLCEKPENLHQLFESKMHTRISYNPKNLSSLQKISIIRSAELVYIAYKKDLVEVKNPLLLDALLYGVKYKGCSISQEEIEEIEKLKSF